jgi:hypothetical protein
MAHGVSYRMDGYWDQEPEGIPRVNLENNNRKNRLISLGNAVVPQLVLELFRAIETHKTIQNATQP